MLKKDLRSDYKKHRKSITDRFLLEASEDIATAVLDLPIWCFNFFHIYLPISKMREVDTAKIISILKKKNKNVVIPKITGKTELRHYLLTEGTEFQLNAWNIPEPTNGREVAGHKIDVVFLPLLAFDLNGNRVGYGKGFYDTFLKECRADVIKIGLSLFKAEEIISDINEHDIPLDYCVTPEKTYVFT